MVCRVVSLQQPFPFEKNRRACPYIIYHSPFGDTNPRSIQQWTHIPCRNFEESNKVWKHTLSTLMVQTKLLHFFIRPKYWKKKNVKSLLQPQGPEVSPEKVSWSEAWRVSSIRLIQLVNYAHEVPDSQMVPASSGSFHSCFSIGKSSCSDTKPQFLEVYRPQMNETGVVFYVLCQSLSIYIYNSMTSLNSIPTDLMADEFVGLPPKSPLVLAGPFQETQLVCIPTCWSVTIRGGDPYEKWPCLGNYTL